MRTIARYCWRAGRRDGARARLEIALCALVAAWLCALPAQAQNEDAARAASARALFEEGVGLADQGQWHEASDRFRRALALRDSAVIAYNLASALQETGQLVEASELLRRVRGDESAEAELRTSASNALTAIEPRIAKLDVHVDGLQPDDHVKLDERALLPAELDVALPIDPGPHTLRVERADRVVAERAITLAPGESQNATLQIATAAAPTPREVAVAAPPPARAPAHSEPDEAPPLTGRWWFWAGIGAAAVGIGVVAIALASSGGDEPKPAAGDFEPGVVGVELP